MKVISYSLFGDNPIYTYGALENCNNRDKFFKDWEIRFYINSTVPEKFVNELQNRGAVCINMKKDEQFANTMWRFLPASEEGVNYFISRDCDSRLSLRDSISVQEWIESGRYFHIIRDHPTGHYWPVNAGMWGSRGGSITNISNLIESYIASHPYLVSEKTIDQIFLKDIIYPEAINSLLLHDEYFNYEGIGRSIKLLRSYDNYDFIGESVDENNIPRGDQRTPIKNIFLSKQQNEN